MRFEEMELREELLRAIQELDYTEPTPIQERAIPLVLEGRDLMCCAQTGTGKTAAFALPILHRLAEKERVPLQALILVPTRELAIQVGKNLREYGKHLDLVSTTVFGGVPIEPQEMMLRHGVNVLVATPGRLKDHMWRGNIDFRHTQYLILDEADRMLDMGFIKDVREIVEMLPTERQSMLFSATLDQEIRRLARDILKDPLRIEVAPPSTTLEEVEQFLVRTDRREKQSTLERLIRQQQMKRAIIFVRTKIGASKLAGRLRDHGHKASAIHSDRSQSERIRALEGFREGRVHFLIATDIAARGIDVQDVSHVVNYDIPHSAEDYVHRIGRTARAGRKGMAISLVTSEDSRVVEAIERLISMRLSWLGQDEPVSGNGGRASHKSPQGSRRRTPRSRSGNGHRASREVEEKATSAVAPRRSRSRPRSEPSERSERQPVKRRLEADGEPVAPRRRRRRRSQTNDSNRTARAETPAHSNGSKPAGIVQAFLGRLRSGLSSRGK